MNAPLGEGCSNAWQRRLKVEFRCRDVAHELGVKWIKSLNAQNPAFADYELSGTFVDHVQNYKSTPGGCYTHPLLYLIGLSTPARDRKLRSRTSMYISNDRGVAVAYVRPMVQ